MADIVQYDGAETSSVQLRLNSKGMYTWTIFIKVAEGVGPTQVATQLRNFDEALRSAFPNHARKGRGKMVGFN